MRSRIRALALALATLGTASSLVACTVGPETSQRATGTSASSTAPVVPSSTPVPVVPAQRVGGVVPEPPVSLTLPDGTVVRVRSVSTTSNGVLDVPEEIDDAGWWRGGSKIGDPFGSTLVAAHVDSLTEGLGPFAELLSVRPGQQVVVRTRTLQQTFEVRSRRLRPRGAISGASALHSPAGVRRLTLVTCASPYVPELGGYQNLAVVVADPVGEPTPRTS